MTNNNFKKAFAVMFLCLVGTISLMAQTGNVTRKYYMTNLDGKKDTCSVTIFFKEGKVTELDLTLNNKGKGSYITAYISKNAKYFRNITPEKKINDFRNLIDTLQTKYVNWSKTAKENKIVNYQKKIGDFKNVPIMNLVLYRNNIIYIQPTEYPYLHQCTPYFSVNKKGECSIFFGFVNIDFERTKGYTQGTLVSYPIKEEVTENLVQFEFHSKEELQSLKDALDIETARQQLLGKANSNKSIDSLFK